MKGSETFTKIFKSISLLQGEIEDLQKDKKGYGYKYADLAQSLKILRPLLVKNGLAVIQMPGFVEDRVSLETIILHESGEWISGIMEIPITVGKGMIAAQACGSTISYARRYALISIMGFAAEDDDLGSIAANPPSMQQVLPPLQIDPFKPRTGEQITKIINFVDNDESRIKKMCKHYKVNSLTELSQEQLTSILKILSGPSMEINKGK